MTVVQVLTSLLHFLPQGFLMSFAPPSAPRSASPLGVPNSLLRMRCMCCLHTQLMLVVGDEMHVLKF